MQNDKISESEKIPLNTITEDEDQGKVNYNYLTLLTFLETDYQSFFDSLPQNIPEHE